MTDQDLTDLTLAAAAAQIKNREFSPVELTELMLARIDRLNPELVAYVTVAREEALSDARAAEAEIRAGRPSHVMFHFQVGGSSYAKALKSIELFASEIRPAVEKVLGPLDDVGVPTARAAE